MIVKLIVFFVQLVLVHSIDIDEEIKRIRSDQDRMIDILENEGFSNNVALLKVFGKQSTGYFEAV